MAGVTNIKTRFERADDSINREFNPSLAGKIEPNISVSLPSQINFKAKLQQPLSNDTVELSTDKKEDKKSLTKAQKWGLGIGGAIAALTITGIAFASHQHSKISKLYKEKLILSNLPEKIEFKEAKTVEEAIKFAKEVLGIKEVDKAFAESLDAINTANRGLVDVSNANKGKLFLPPRLHYKELENNTIAGVVRDIESQYFGDIVINKKYFDEKLLNEQLDKYFKIRNYAPKSEAVSKSTDAAAKETTGMKKRQDLIDIQWSEDFRKLANKYMKSVDSVTMMEKRQLLGIYENTCSSYSNLWDRNPYSSIVRNKKVFADLGIKVDLDKISQMSLKEQSTEFERLCREYNKKTNKILQFNSAAYSQEETIWHEMGHLQDYAKNLKTLDLKKWEIGTKKWWKNHFKKDIKELEKDSQRNSVDELNNHWGCIWDDQYKKIMEENPKKFRKLYPDMYEFLKDSHSQHVAGCISGYAQSGIGEFIAESYKEMIRLNKEGKKIQEDIMKLYRKYNGPELPA